jgi:membrane protease YdiL (CAAX protease family)
MMKRTEPVLSAAASRPRFLAPYHAILPRLGRSPAFWLFAGVYVLALVMYIPLGGTVRALLDHFLVFLYCDVLVLFLVIPLTSEAPPAAWEEPAPYSRARLWAQLGVVLLFLALFVALTVLLFDPTSVPGLGPFVLTWFRQHSALAQPIVIALVLVICLLPLGILRLLGASFRELGFGRGYHTWRVAAVGSAVPAGILVILLVLGHITLLALGLETLKAALNAGFPEEVLFRGILLTRLVRLPGTQWGIALAVSLFAIVHLEVNLSSDGSVLLAIADMVLTQASLGILFVIVFLRTRNILAGVVVHTIVDTFSSLAGV